ELKESNKYRKIKTPATIIAKLEIKTIFLGVMLESNVPVSLLSRYVDILTKRFLSYDIIKSDTNNSHSDNIYNAYFKPVLFFMAYISWVNIHLSIAKVVLFV
ncbi:hypothetical protein D6155_24625, partial [Salmonella enterica]|nr:hypothetical protein [Salmonella enterica]EAU8796003.1 hypothetical protein [Salmonella enterica]